MIRITLLALALSATGAAAQTAGGQDDCEDNQANSNQDCAAALLNGTDAAAAAEAEGVTGFVPLVAPALGGLAAAAGLAAAGGGGGATPSTTSTVSTN